MEQAMPFELSSEPLDTSTEPVKAVSSLKKKQSSKKTQKAAPSQQHMQQQMQQQQQQVSPQQKDAPAEQASHRVTLHKHLRKTRFCMYHLQGACQFGSECSFAHSLAEMHQTPDLRKTQLCKAFVGGMCNDPTCMFAHGDQELRSTDMFFKKTICIWHEKGKCRNGERCRFAHGVKELRARQAPGDIEQPIPQGNGKVRKNSKERGVPPGGSADPMKINPNFMQFDNAVPAMNMPISQAAAMNMPISQATQASQAAAAAAAAAALQFREQAPPAATAGGNGKSGNDLNNELGQLCQSIAILTAQCNNIQKRMELEAEFNNIQRRAESMGMQPLASPFTTPAPTYAGYAGQSPLGQSPALGQQAPYPPGLGSLSEPNMPMSAGQMAAVLQAMKTQGQYY
jgi:hypothetical protein